MKRHFHLFIYLVLLFAIGNVLAQQPRPIRRATATAEEIVSLSSSTSFDQAILIFNELSKPFLDKAIIDPEERTGPIGISINQMHWLTALETILKENGLWYEERSKFIIITEEKAATPSGVPQKSKSERIAEELFNTREVTITAVFFEANKSKLRQAGIDWSFLRDNQDILVRAETSAGADQGGLLELEFSPKLDFADITAIFKALEDDQMGQIITSPQVTVRSGSEGSVQVGADISVTLQDFAGNAVTQFFKTGSIIKVTPEIVNHEGSDFIGLELEIERSNTVTGDNGLEIRKSEAKTSVILLDGEETVIGGLSTTQENASRRGIPFLKDLPPWLLGLRYVFGFEATTSIESELVILLKAELLPPIKNRLEAKAKGLKQKRLLQEQRKRRSLEMQLYELQTKDKK